MSATLAWDAAAQEDLGGGIIAMRRSDGEAIVLASSLAAARCTGFVTPASVDARDESVLRAWLSHWGFGTDVRVVSVDQVHGSTVVAASTIDPRLPPEADGLWTDSPADVLTTRSADCAPIWIAGTAAHNGADRARLVMLHAGWRGTADGIIENGVRAVGASDPASLHAAVGPCIGAECYEVGPEVAERFRELEGTIRPADTLRVPRSREDSWALDLRAAIRALLLRCGIRPERIAISNACTRCRSDLFHSYRRTGPGGPLTAALGAVLAH